MEIAILVFLFLVGTVASAMQALRYLEQHYRSRDRSPQARTEEPPRGQD